MEAKGTHGSRLSPKSWNQQRGRSPVRDLRQRRTHFPQDQFYDTLYGANAKREKVPEAYMIPLPKEDAMRRNSAGRMINQLPDPDLVNFWQHPQATSQKTEVTIMPREFQTPMGGAPCAHLKPKATTPERQRAPREATGTHGRRLSPKSWNQQRGRSPVRDLRQRRTHFPQDEFYDTAARTKRIPTERWTT